MIKDILGAPLSIPDIDPVKETGYFPVVSKAPEIIYHLLPYLDLSLDELIAKETDREVEIHYLAWQSVRHINGEQTSRLTGFEPYFIGQGLNAEQIALKIAQIGKEALDSIRTRHKEEPSFMKGMYRALLGQEANLTACQEMDVRLGTITAKLRGAMNQEARQFQSETYNSLLSRGIEYRIIPAQEPSEGYYGRIIKQSYWLPRLRWRQELAYPAADQCQIAEFDPANPYHFMHLLGRAGHPLFRELVR